ncbi:hypothetical protein E4U42_005660 [Claviceps africana]|uniref:Uncharacterized protein n=1 Tax=Claviceps africana TaxID=83212 RepID=A0A8K0JHI2_9HYPO|nr:hypothetical protein E4U42_005660 [Claviceps africana]
MVVGCLGRLSTTNGAAESLEFASDRLDAILPHGQSLLTSLETPVLSKWIVVALVLSVSFNGYLFNVNRSGDATDHSHAARQRIDLVERALGVMVDAGFKGMRVVSLNGN